MIAVDRTVGEKNGRTKDRGMVKVEVGLKRTIEAFGLNSRAFLANRRSVGRAA